MPVSAHAASYLRQHLLFIENTHFEKWKVDHDALGPVWMLEDLVSQVITLFESIGKADTDARIYFSQNPGSWNQAVLDQYKAILKGWHKNALIVSALVERVAEETGHRIDKANELQNQIKDAEWALAEASDLFNVDEFKSLEDAAIQDLRSSK